jgi:hypothetical protein
MTSPGKYCKAYPIARFREFAGWYEDERNARPVDHEPDNAKAGQPRKLETTDFLYLHDDFTVTDGVLVGKYVIFENVTPEWISFCQTTLGFQPPDLDS